MKKWFAEIFIGIAVYSIVASVFYVKGYNTHLVREQTFTKTIENLQKANEFFKNGYYMYKGKFIQSDFENKHLRTDSAKALRFTVKIYDNKY